MGRHTPDAGRAALLAALLVGISACGRSDSPTSALTRAARRATTILVSPSAVSFEALGDTLRLGATVLDQNGVQLSGATVNWTSSDTGVVTVSSDGTLVARANGNAVVTAASDSARATASVTVDQTPGSISVSGTRTRLSFLGDTLTLSSGVLDANGRTVEDAPLTWSSSDDHVAEVDSTGLVTAVSPGVVSIVATTTGSVTGGLSLTVEQVPVTLSLAPDSLVLIPGETASITASAFDAGGSGIAGPTVAWASSDDAVATVDDAGMATAVATGTATISATVDGDGGRAVGADLRVHVTSTPRIATDTLPPGVVTKTYDAVLVAVGGDGSYTWAIVAGSLPAGLSLESATGRITGTPSLPGSELFTVQVTDGSGETATRPLNIDVYPPVQLTTSYLTGGYPSTPYSDAIAAATGGDGEYTYAITAGALPAGLMLDVSSGVISGVTTGTGMSFFEVTATSVGQSASALYSMTISTNPPSGFNMWAVSVAPSIPTPAVQAEIDAVLARWEAVVVGDLGASVVPASIAGSCNDGDDLTSLLTGAAVDDVLVLVDVRYIDGPGPGLNVLAYAAPCVTDTAAPYTVVGRLALDSSNLALMPDVQVFETTWHEIGHIMGIGTHWLRAGLMSGYNTPNPRFLGLNANDEWQALGGTTAGVPVEADGGAGTAYSHWDEGWFDQEVMTGYAEPGTTPNEPISRMTIASLADLGWNISYAAADPYSIPFCAPNCTATKVGPSLTSSPGGGVEGAPGWREGTGPVRRR